MSLSLGYGAISRDYEFVGTAVDTAGVSVMVIGAIIATARFLLKSQTDALNAYRVVKTWDEQSSWDSNSLWLGTLFGLSSSTRLSIIFSSSPSSS
jgi:hypothetical protein